MSRMNPKTARAIQDIFLYRQISKLVVFFQVLWPVGMVVCAVCFMKESLLRQFVAIGIQPEYLLFAAFFFLMMGIATKYVCDNNFIYMSGEEWHYAKKCTAADPLVSSSEQRYISTVLKSFNLPHYDYWENLNRFHNFQVMNNKKDAYISGHRLEYRSDVLGRQCIRLDEIRVDYGIKEIELILDDGHIVALVPPER